MRLKLGAVLHSNFSTLRAFFPSQCLQPLLLHLFSFRGREREHLQSSSQSMWGQVQQGNLCSLTTCCVQKKIGRGKLRQDIGCTASAYTSHFLGSKAVGFHFCNSAASITAPGIKVRHYLAAPSALRKTTYFT